MHKSFIRHHAKPSMDIKYPRAANPASWTPNQIFGPAPGYGLPKLPGTIIPQTIGIIELGGGIYPGDAAAAFSSFGLPAPDLEPIIVGGGSNRTGGDADGEMALDYQWAAAAYSYMTGLKAKINLYCGGNTDADFVGCYTKARLDKVAVTSNSWGSSESNYVKAYMQAMFNELALHIAAGIWGFSASGDNDSSDGSPGLNVDYPASDPSMIGCGGTTKTRSAESVWNNGNGEGTGGGYSSVFPVQSWQIGAPNGPGRMVPDIAANADPDTGYPVWIGGSMQIIGGTSAVAPIMAGIFAALKGWLLGQNIKPPVNLLEWLWSHPAAFGDILVGNNGQWKALSGPDPCTGLGVPNGEQLLTAISGGTVIKPPVVPPPVTPPVNPPPIVPPPPGNVVVPNVVSMPWAAAKAALSAVGLGISPIAAGSPNQFVLAESPLAGTSVAPGSTVTVTLSKLITLPPSSNRTFTLSHDEKAGKHLITGGGVHSITFIEDTPAGTYYY